MNRLRLTGIFCMMGLTLGGCHPQSASDPPLVKNTEARSTMPTGQADTAPVGTTADPAASMIIAYYFHRTVRCHGCQQIEFMADQAIRQHFPKELEQGRLIWLVLDMDEPKNQPFVKEYDLNVSTLVLANSRKNENREWKKLEKVWELHGDSEAFNQYVSTEIAAALSGEKR
jgi:hypothetical protein